MRTVNVAMINVQEGVNLRSSMSDIRVTTLSCGAIVLCEQMSGVRSAAISCVIPGGSAYDPEDAQGRATMWVKLLLRGSMTLSSREQAAAFDRLGASRGTDLGSYSVRIAAGLLGTQLASTLPLIVEMVRTPLIEDAAIEPCRELAFAAIESMKDDPQERASHLARDRHYPAPLNRSGLGTVDGLTALNAARLRDEWRKVAVPAGANRSGSIFGFAGAIETEKIEAQLEELTAGWLGATSEPPLTTVPLRGYAHADDPSNQVQILLLHDAPSESDPDSVLEKIVVNVLSGGMAGRLFTQVREKRGLCYSVSAGYRGDRDFGSLSAYVGTTPQKAQQSLDVLFEELDSLSLPKGRITQEEFDRAITGMKTNIVFSGESSGARAATIVSDYRRLGRPRTLDEITREVSSISLEQVNDYLARRRMGRITVQTLGPTELVPPHL